MDVPAGKCNTGDFAGSFTGINDVEWAVVVRTGPPFPQRYGGDKNNQNGWNVSLNSIDTVNLTANVTICAPDNASYQYSVTLNWPQGGGGIWFSEIYFQVPTGGSTDCEHSGPCLCGY